MHSNNNNNNNNIKCSIFNKHIMFKIQIGALLMIKYEKNTYKRERVTITNLGIYNLINGKSISFL